MKPTVLMTQTHAFQHRAVDIVHLPLVATIGYPLERAVLDISYDWLIFSSKNAVAYFLPYYPYVDVKYIAVIGEKTQAYCEKHGIAVDFIPDDYSQEGFLERFEAEQHARILIPSSAKARPKLAQTLSARGYHVTKVDLYNTVAHQENVQKVYELLETHQVDAITFASASAVRALFDTYPHSTFDQMFTIGQQTYRTLKSYGYESSLARQQTLDAMIEKILEKRS
ncbi:uroporphyrinogen-III synthase [Staphylococcus sp. 17KM0847]|uniref:uroporphyrinogen-III synthase n=1 Tax=Staphylococcus sp. 17KM0847 TaxID=2583989 RepID=UPI0015DC8F85|nr:uroporphyrinogen-III synthase [Staphylococcus sp. 17KM0847]QLK86963.1 uroporphyrinogen-III synthase [Staphylococcus sp. 17KM0847]